MLSLANILLASQFFLMSDQGHFWNTDEISSHTQLLTNDLDHPIPLDASLFTNQKILILVHGYNEDAQDALALYKLIQDQIDPLKDANGHDLYDSVIGYLWPGDDHFYEYYTAENNADKLAKRMRNHLTHFFHLTTQIDVLAHSMGTRLMFEALCYPAADNTKKTIQNFYSLAAAVNSDSIEKHHPYYRATEHCENLFVFHSDRDDVLKLVYPFVEWEQALGSEGVAHWNKTPLNVQLIDCTDFVSSHSGYFTAPPFYEFIHKQHLNELLPPYLARNVKVLENGTIQTISQ